MEEKKDTEDLSEQSIKKNGKLRLWGNKLFSTAKSRQTLIKTIVVFVFLELFLLIVLIASPISDKGGLIGGIFAGCATVTAFLVTSRENKLRFEKLQKDNDKLLNDQNEKERLSRQPWLDGYFKVIDKFKKIEIDPPGYCMTIGDVTKWDEKTSWRYYIPNEAIKKWDIDNRKEEYRIERPNIILEYRLTNIGANNAVNIEMYIRRHTFQRISLIRNQNIYLYIHMNIEKLKENVKLPVMFKYNDINSEFIYKQSTEINLSYDQNDKLRIGGGRLSEPRLLERDIEGRITDKEFIDDHFGY